MIAASFAEQVRKDGLRIALRTGEEDWTYARLLSGAMSAADSTAPSDQLLGIAGGPLPTTVMALITADLRGVTPCLFPTAMNEATRNDWAAKLARVDQFEPNEQDDNPSTSFPAQSSQPAIADLSPGLWLFTSGTTGVPQPVRHRWQALTSTSRTDSKFQNRRWLLAYDPASFAGLQVVLQALLSGGTLSDVSQATPAKTARRMISEQVEFASGTPTFWRMLLGAVDSQLWKQATLKQITLGGEVVSEGTLTALRTAFPQARISHIYATSELGVCFSVSDAQAGFPASYLQNPPAECQLRISAAGELEVLSNRRGCTLAQQNECSPASASEARWQSTGDLVELRDERVYFVGRKSGVIHVGGAKIVPEEVEAIIREVPGVVEVRISGQPSSVLGAIVRADVVAVSAAESNTVRAAILAACQAQLPRQKVPAMIEFHTTLPRTPSGKLARRGEVEDNIRPQQ